MVAVATSNTVSETIGLKLISSWPKTVRIVAYLKRWLARKRGTLKRNSVTIDSTEFKEAETTLLKNIQKVHISEELEQNCKNFSKQSAIYQYSPIVDQDGLIRCASRLRNSTEYSFEITNPIILPGENELVDLYIRWVHDKICLHAGSIAGVMQRVRERFLIIRARKAARKAVTKCKVCAKYRAQPVSEIIPPLPNFRFKTAPPFAVTGVDAAGPFRFKSEDGKILKSYIMLFSCPVTRAVRLELVPNLTLKNFW